MTRVFSKLGSISLSVYLFSYCSIFDSKYRSSLRPEVDKPAYGSFVDIDIKKEGRISLRTLVG